MQTFTSTNGSRIPAALAIRGTANLARRSDESPAARRTLSRGEEIFAEGGDCTHFFKVASGTVRTVKLLSDGRRQIEAFHLPGDVFGLESGATHRFTAEAVDDVVLVAYRRNRFANLVQADPAFGEELMASMLTSLDRAHEHMVLLGRKTALEKLATFLLELGRRMSHGDRVELPMQRSDIADHLGLTIETVSRTLTQMVRDGLIRFAEAGRTIILANRARLQLLGV
jgi:CRP/FNR family nitrogen fixation transcriptional regulator